MPISAGVDQALQIVAASLMWFECGPNDKGYFQSMGADLIYSLCEISIAHVGILPWYIHVHFGKFPFHKRCACAGQLGKKVKPAHVVRTSIPTNAEHYSNAAPINNTWQPTW